MSTLQSLIHDSALATTIGAIAYSTTVTTAALTALLARTPDRRRNALAVLRILLHRDAGQAPLQRSPRIVITHGGRARHRRASGGRWT
jgi:hypothetical protein